MPFFPQKSAEKKSISPRSGVTNRRKVFYTCRGPFHKFFGNHPRFFPREFSLRTFDGRLRCPVAIFPDCCSTRGDVMFGCIVVSNEMCELLCVFCVLLYSRCALLDVRKCIVLIDLLCWKILSIVYA